MIGTGRHVDSNRRAFIQLATSEAFDKVADNVEGAVKSVTERGREVGQEMQAVAGNLKTAVDTSVKDQPMATLAVVAALGFVLGAVWKS